MTVTSTRPYGGSYAAEIEAPHFGPNVVPGHMEAIWVYGYDSQQHVGYYHYLLAEDESGTVRRETSYVFLPDRTVLTRRSRGRKSRSGVAAGDTVEISCQEPFRRWSSSMRAEMQQLPLSNWRTGEVEPALVPVELDLQLNAVLPVWDTEGEDGDPPPAFRYHQLNVATGALAVGAGSERVVRQLSGSCFRSHSVRRRSVPGFTGHFISNVQFPSGRAVGVLAYRAQDGGLGRARGFYDDGQRQHQAVVKDASFLTSAKRDDAVHLSLETEVGTLKVTGRTVAGVFTTLLPGDRGPANGGNNQLGAHLEDERRILFSVAFAEFELDGERAIGPCERSVSVGCLGSAA